MEITKEQPEQELYLAQIVYKKAILLAKDKENPLMSTVALVEADKNSPDKAAEKLKQEWKKNYSGFVIVRANISAVIR